MYLYIVNFLRLLYGFCLFYFVEGENVGVTIPSREIVREHLHSNIFDVNMLQAVLDKASYAGIGKNKWDNKDCSKGLCQNYQKRLKRSAFSESSIAQSNQKDDDDNDIKNKQPLLSQITPYAFGNPSLPEKSKKGKSKQKPRKPRG